MKKKNTLFTLIQIIVIMCLSVTFTGNAQESKVDLNNYLQTLKNDLNLASISVALVHNNKIVWKDACGKANIEENIDATTKHLYAHGSVSKLFTGTVLLKLYEEGKLDLDDNINMYLPYSVRNPEYPDSPITFRMLMTQTSSIAYSDIYTSLYNDGDPKTSLSDVTAMFFDPEGEYYKTENFLDYKPGSGWKYSNWNFTLIGCIIENVTGRKFNEYCKEVLLEPLEMNTSGWFLKEVDESNIATIYNKRDNIHYPRNQFSWPGYCDGSFRANAEEASNFLIMIMNEGSLNGKQILKPETIKEMLSPQNIKNLPGHNKDMALVWFMSSGSQAIYSHDGSPTGSIAVMKYNSDTKSAIVCYITGLEKYTPQLISRLEASFQFLLEQAAGM